MGVSSLWKVLDKAGCGKPVGAKELVDPDADSQKQAERVNPWTYGEVNTTTTPSKPNCLAVDLSIWICESLTSHAMGENHVNPTMHLVFSRTMKLLNLGIELVFVIEGKRRIRSNEGEEDKFHKRRSGTAFWKACRDCQEMLELLGVPVVRAKAEGEALCALLNQRGIVDGVISNDGDCLLFGAKVVYTKFSIENLDNSTVMRYDLSNLHAVVQESDDKDISNNEVGTLMLSRQDLIAFALLTGSDLAGNGFHKVGHKKAIRFIRKCQLDYPLSVETAAIDELKSWSRAAAICPTQPETTGKKPEKCCSRCSHPGSKRSHEKHGCEQCGTEPGEPCFELTAEDRFRKSLRAKALAMRPKFEPSQVVAAYMRPNDNQIPIQFAGVSPGELEMGQPSFKALMQMPFIVKGRSLEGSREYIKKSVGRLLARAELTRRNESHSRPDQQPQRLSRGRPVPQEITKALTQNQVPCYEVTWLVNATITDEEGEGIDGYEYSTVEPRELIDKHYPALVTAFQEAEKERKKQGDAEKTRRRAFLESLLAPLDATEGEGVCDDQQSPKKRKAPQVKKRAGFFQSNRPQVDYSRRRKNRKGGQDVSYLLRFACLSDKPASPAGTFAFSPISSKKASRAMKLEPAEECYPISQNQECDNKASRLIVDESDGHRPKRKRKRKRQRTHDKTREEFFRNKRPRTDQDDYAFLSNQQGGDDVGHLLRGTKPGTPMSPTSSKKAKRGTGVGHTGEIHRRTDNHKPNALCTPGKSLFCNMGDFLIEITPIEANHSVFPPRHVFVRSHKSIE